MKEKILVTGCAGFLAKYLIAEAMAKGYDVRGVDVNDCNIQGIEFVKGDILDQSVVDRAMNGVDYVMHLAAITANTEFTKNPKVCYEINVNGFLNVLEAARVNKVKKVVYASSSAVYVDKFSEDAIIEIRQKRDHYAKTKLINEMMAHSYSLIYGMPTVGLRIFNLYGNGENVKGDYASVVMKFLDFKRKGEPLVLFGDGKQARDLTYVVDAAKVAVIVMEKGTEQVYNLGSGRATVYNDVADMIDPNNKKYIPNPLPSYQLFTQADRTRIDTLIDGYKFKSVKEALKEM